VKSREYTEQDATSLAELVRRGDVTPSELLDRAVAQIDAHNGQVNAVVRRLYDRARAKIDAGLPEGPLRGVPILIKDLGAHIAGVPTTGGSRLLEGFVPQASAEIVRRYEAAGAVIVGKTNTPELGIVGITEPKLYGPTRNPWGLDRTPGGSSGGSASAVALRMTPVGHAGDGGGSIRIPASCTGLVGLKPSRGRVPNGPKVGGAWSGFTCQHAVCRTVRDSAMLLDVVAGPSAGEPHNAPAPERPFVEEVGRDPGKLRIASCIDTLLAGRTHPEVADGLERASKLCEGLGHRVEPARPELDKRTLARTYLRMIAGNVYAEVEAAQRAVGRKASSTDIEAPTRLLYDIGRKGSAGLFAEAMIEVERVGRTMAEFHRDYDILMLPTIATPPAMIGQFEPKPAEAFGLWLLRRFPVRPLLAKALDQLAFGMLEVLPNTQPFNMSGQPAISLPLHTSDGGLPIGIQFVAPYGREDLLIRLASQLEAAEPWIDRRPPLLDQL